ncbi:MAG: hypothetical protein AB1626_00095 [Candidatus Micrarchaeota archaeon]
MDEREQRRFEPHYVIKAKLDEVRNTLDQLEFQSRRHEELGEQHTDARMRLLRIQKMIERLEQTLETSHQGPAEAELRRRAVLAQIKKLKSLTGGHFEKYPLGK